MARENPCTATAGLLFFRPSLLPGELFFRLSS